MARTLTPKKNLLFAVALSACAGAPALPAAESVPTMANQKLLADVVAAAFARIDGLALRNVVAGKNVAIRVATTYPVEASIVEAHAAMLLNRAGAVRADLARGGDVQALILLRAYGVRQADVSDGLQERAFLLGDLIIQVPGRGEVFREALAAKAADHYYSDGTRERRTPGRRASAPKPEPMRAAEPPPPVASEEPKEYDPDPPRDDAPRDRQSSRSRDRRDSSRAREQQEEAPRANPPPPRRERRSRSRKKRRSEEADEAEKPKPRPKRRNRRRRRQRQPLILE
jgi:hypothetical protein